MGFKLIVSSNTNAVIEIFCCATVTHVVCSPFVLECQTKYCAHRSGVCPGSVGTRQALLQGWLLCFGFVCLANVPDLVRGFLFLSLHS